MIRKIEVGIRLLFGGFVVILIGFISKNLGLIIMGLIVTIFGVTIIKYYNEKNNILVDNNDFK